MGISVSSPGASDVGEGHITVSPFAYSAITQGTWVFGAAGGGTSYCAGGLWNSTQDQNDAVEYLVYLAAGTYTFWLMAVTATDEGIITMSIDGTSQGTMDFYSNPAVYNVRKTITGIVIPTSGLVTLQLKIATKNAASSQYQNYIQQFGMFRTA